MHRQAVCADRSNPKASPTNLSRGEGTALRLVHDQDRARDFYEKAKQEQRDGRFFPERYQRGGYELVGDTIDRHLRTIGTKKDQRAERYFGAWWKETLKDKRLNQITPDLLEGIRQDLLTTGSDPEAESPKPCTLQRVNRYVAWLRHVLNEAVRHGKLASNPVIKLKMFREPKGRVRFLTEDEEQKLLGALGPIYGPWARLAILTGMRQMEQFRLKWADVDLDLGLITLPSTKAGEVQYVHLNGEAKTILGSLIPGNASIWVFPSENPDTHMDPRNFYSRVWMPAVKRAGIEWATWHDLRHTFASRLAMQGASERTLAALLRHASTALVQRYAHLSPSHLRAAVEGLSRSRQSIEDREQEVCQGEGEGKFPMEP